MAEPRRPPYPVINPNPAFWQSMDAMDSKDYAFVAAAAIAGAAIGIYAGRGLNHKVLSPFNLAVTMGIGSATCAVFKGSLHGYQRLKGLKDNGLPAVYTEFERFKNAPRASIETLHHLDRFRNKN